MATGVDLETDVRLREAVFLYAVAQRRLHDAALGMYPEREGR